MKILKGMIPVLVILGMFVAIATDVESRAGEPLPNSKFLAEVEPLRFATSGAATDTLNGNASSDSTTTVGIQGVQSALLHLLVYLQDGDQNDSIEVNVAFAVIDTGKTRRYSVFSPIDTIRLTEADDSYTVHTVDLMKSSIATALKGVALEDVAEFRFRFDSYEATSAIIHVKPYLDRVWEVSPRR